MKTARLRTEDENSRIEMDRRGGGGGGDAGIDSVVSRMAWRRDDVSPFGIEHNHRFRRVARFSHGFPTRF